MKYGSHHPTWDMSANQLSSAVTINLLCVSILRQRYAGARLMCKIICEAMATQPIIL